MSSDNTSIPKSSFLSPRRVYLYTVCVVLAWLILGLLPIMVNEAWDKRGQFGDMFGAVNSLFSALAFAGVIITILLQREELALQRHELEQTRGELARTASAQEASEKALGLQASALATTARLNALSAVVDHLRSQKDHVKGVSATRELQEKHDTYVAALEQELAHLLTNRPSN